MQDYQEIRAAVLALHPLQKQHLALQLRKCRNVGTEPKVFFETPTKPEWGRTFPLLGGSRLDLEPALDYEAQAVEVLYHPPEPETVTVQLARCDGLDQLGERLGHPLRALLIDGRVTGPLEDGWPEGYASRCLHRGELSPVQAGFDLWTLDPRAPDLDPAEHGPVKVVDTGLEVSMPRRMGWWDIRALLLQAFTSNQLCQYARTRKGGEIIFSRLGEDQGLCHRVTLDETGRPCPAQHVLIIDPARDVGRLVRTIERVCLDFFLGLTPGV